MTKQYFTKSTGVKFNLKKEDVFQLLTYNELALRLEKLKPENIVLGTLLFTESKKFYVGYMNETVLGNILPESEAFIEQYHELYGIKLNKTIIDEMIDSYIDEFFFTMETEE